MCIKTKCILVFDYQDHKGVELFTNAMGMAQYY